MTRSEQIALNTLINIPFNKPIASGAHLQKTWDYLASHGVGDDLEFKQGEVIDHIRAWKGRTQIYRCVFEQDMWGFFGRVGCETMVLCARDDVLWTYFQYVKGLKSGVKAVEIGGANFGLDRDVQGIEKSWTEFLEETEKKGQD